MLYSHAGAHNHVTDFHVPSIMSNNRVHTGDLSSLSRWSLMGMGGGGGSFTPGPLAGARGALTCTKIKGS